MKTARTQRGSLLLSCLLALVLAFGLSPAAFAASFEDPDAASTQASAQNVASFQMYDVSASSGISVQLTEWAFEEGATVADMTRALLEANGIKADAQETEYGYYLNGVYGADGKLYAWDEATGAYWGLYVNGVSSSVGASSVVLKPGDVVTWCYAPYDESGQLPARQEGFSPDAPLADLGSAWASYAGSNAGKAEGSLPITGQSAHLSWRQGLLQSEGAYANSSDLLIVDGKVYVAESDSVWGSGTSKARINVFDANTGKIEKSAVLPYAVGSTCRMAYADGVIAVPTEDGGLLGVAADTLAPRWYVAPGLDGAQSLNKVTVHEGYFVHSYSQLGDDWKATQSRTVAVNAATGALKWAMDSDKGSYWSGATFVDGALVMGTDAGTLRVVDFETGRVLKENPVSQSASIRSVPVSCGGNEVVFTTNDGVLVKASVDAKTGLARVVGNVQFAAGSTCTPAVVDGVAVVGGSTSDYKGVVAEIDVKTMRVSTSHAALADVKSAPVVAQGNDGAWYAYYTCNSAPGALYGVRLGDVSASPFTVFEPTAADSNYCMASPVADGEGRLFYTNDSGTLFAVSHDLTCGYADVQPGDWFVQGGLLERAVGQGLIGRGSTEFRPRDAITRAEVVTVIYRAAGEPVVGQSAGFSDVAEGDWFRDAVLWAQGAGVVSGYGAGAFGPNDPVTREQLSVMLANFAERVAGADVSSVDLTVLDAFPDETSVDEWGRKSMAWCVSNKIISGVPTDSEILLSPLVGADRSMMAKMILLALDALA